MAWTAEQRRLYDVWMSLDVQRHNIHIQDTCRYRALDIYSMHTPYCESLDSLIVAIGLYIITRNVR